MREGKGLIGKSDQRGRLEKAMRKRMGGRKGRRRKGGGEKGGKKTYIKGRKEQGG